MSLKAFHVAFILVSTLCALGFGLWEANAYAESGETLDLVFTCASFAAGAALIAYSRWFVRKLKNVSYL